ncbi:MAG TPA: type II secretion system protein N [Burkholderiales bacterium]
MATASPARLAGVLLAVALVVSVTDWALTFSARRTMTEPVVVLPAGEVDPQARLTDVAPVARLFGAASSAEAGGIRALGVMAEGASGRGIALLGVNGGPTRSYRTGDVIAPGVVLKEVRKDGVVLSRSGRLQELRLPTKSTPAPAPIQR